MSVGAIGSRSNCVSIFIVRALDVRCFSEDTGGQIFYKALPALRFRQEYEPEPQAIRRRVRPLEAHRIRPEPARPDGRRPRAIERTPDSKTLFQFVS